MKKPNQCLFCRSTRCYERVVSVDWVYDEVACLRHAAQLREHSDKAAPGVRKNFISSTAPRVRAK